MSFIDNAVQSALRKLRMGFYHATVSSSADTFRRHAVDAEWGPNIRSVRRISSPLLDIIPAIGSRMAVLSQDGVPEFAAMIGQVWDGAGTPKKMTAWLRANLQLHPGHVELGVQPLGSISIRIGSNSGDLTPGKANSIFIGHDTLDVDLVRELSDTLGKLQEACFQLGAATATPTISGTSPLANAATFVNIGVKAATLKAKVDLVKP